MGDILNALLKVTILIGIAYLYWQNHQKRGTLLYDYDLRKKVSPILMSDFRAQDEDILKFFTHKTYKRYLKTYKGEPFLSPEQVNELGKAYIEFMRIKQGR